MTPQEKFLKKLHDTGGYYTSLNKENVRTGPMIGYAGTYKDQSGKTLQYIGDPYANCSKLESEITILRDLIVEAIPELDDCLFQDKNLSDVFSGTNGNSIVWCGAPMGGLTTAMLLAEHSRVGISKYSFLEKKVKELATPTSREKSDLAFGRHSVSPGDVVIPVEDVCNNFSTTNRMLDIIFGRGAKVPFIFGLLNRSGKKVYSYKSEIYGNKEILVKSIVFGNWPEFRQDDPSVIDYISIPGNLILDPKKNWGNLMNSMASYS
jgi:hypothetical protein